MSSFYVTLPSNSSMKTFPNNTKSDFTTVLNSPLYLDGNYEVALASISFSTDIEIDIGKIIIKNYFKNKYPIFKLEKDVIEIDLFVKNGIKANELIQQINYLLDIHLQLFSLYYFENIYENSRKYIDLESLIKYEKNFFENYKNNQIAKAIVIDHDVWNLDTYILYCSSVDNQQELIKLFPGSYKGGGTFYNVHILKTILDNDPNIELIKLPVFDNGIDYNLIYDQEYFNKELSQKLKQHEAYQKKFSSICKTVDIKFLYNSINNTCSIEVIDKNIEILTEGVCNEYIFLSEKINENQLYNIPHELFLIKYIAIYTDIIDGQIFGDSSSSILQVIPIEDSQSNKIVYNNSGDMHYVKVRKNLFDTINISLKDLQGNQIEFSNDFVYVIAKLHFRKING